MTLLTIIQRACQELGLSAPTSVIGSTNKTAIQMLALLYDTAEEARLAYAWPELEREASVLLVEDQFQYQLPRDFDTMVNQSMWNDNETWPVYGPISPQEMSTRERGLSTELAITELFKIKGMTDYALKIYPTPDSDDAGNYIYYRYQSKSWIRPRYWVEGETYSAGEYCWYDYTGNSAATTSTDVPVLEVTISGVGDYDLDGNYFYTAAGGTAVSSGSSGPLSDTGVTWANAPSAEVEYGATSIVYDTFLKDTDVPLIDARTLIKGVKWKFREMKGFDYQKLMQDWYENLRVRSASKKGGEVLSLSNRPGNLLIGRRNIPETGYGS